MQQPKLSEGARQARAQYAREWRRRNPGRQALYTQRFFERKAIKDANEKEARSNG